MKRAAIGALTIFILIIGPVILFSFFTPSEEFYGFPVPKDAVLVQESEVSKSYEWGKASEENGIPFGYELDIKAKGWKMGERIGASVVYTKRGNRVTLISTSKHLDFIRNE